MFVSTHALCQSSVKPWQASDYLTLEEIALH